jgi:hypothetical protein
VAVWPAIFDFSNPHKTWTAIACESFSFWTLKKNVFCLAPSSTSLCELPRLSLINGKQLSVSVHTNSTHVSPGR